MKQNYPKCAEFSELAAWSRPVADDPHMIKLKGGPRKVLLNFPKCPSSVWGSEKTGTGLGESFKREFGPRQGPKKISLFFTEFFSRFPLKIDLFARKMKQRLIYIWWELRRLFPIERASLKTRNQKKVLKMFNRRFGRKNVRTPFFPILDQKVQFHPKIDHLTTFHEK